MPVLGQPVFAAGADGHAAPMVVSASDAAVRKDKTGMTHGIGSLFRSSWKCAGKCNGTYTLL